MTISPDAILAAIDRHLAAIPAGRSTVTVEEHRDVLLDLCLAVTGAGPAPAADVPVEPELEPALEATDGCVDAPALLAVDEPLAGVPEDFDLELVAADVEVDPPLTGLDLAREVTVPAEGRAGDFPDEIDDVLDDPFGSEPVTAETDAVEPTPAAEPEPEPVEPEPVRVAVVHLRLASSKLGVIARCGDLIDPVTGDTSTPWGEDVTCSDCLARVDEETSPTTDTDDAAASTDPEGEAGEAADGADAPDTADPTVDVALPDDDGSEPSWIHDDGDDTDAPVIHQLAEVEGGGHGKNKIAKAPCGNVETALKTASFTETSTWPDDVTCPDCIAQRHQSAESRTAA